MLTMINMIHQEASREPARFYRQLPPVNAVSQQLFEVENENTGNSMQLTTLFMTFGQFLDHDVAETPQVPCKQKT